MQPPARTTARKLFTLLVKIPGVRFAVSFPGLVISLIRRKSLRTLLFSAPGEFYSPLPDVRYVEKHAAEIFDVNRPVAGIDLRDGAQRALLGEFARFHDEFPFPKDPAPGFRYFHANRFFEVHDGIVLYSVLRRFRPRNIVEVGSGFSSALMLDVNERFLDGSARLTVIDPHPKRMLRLLKPGDLSRQTLIRKPVQEVPLDVFASLGENDVLFIDSSHVVKVGSDVQHLMFQVLPALRPGVLIHFHDILWPFEYCAAYVRWGRAWNEAYVLRALLQGSRDYEILYFNDYMQARHAPELLAKMPRCLDRPGAGMWLRKVGPGSPAS